MKPYVVTLVWRYLPPEGRRPYWATPSYVVTGTDAMDAMQACERGLAQDCTEQVYGRFELVTAVPQGVSDGGLPRRCKKFDGWPKERWQLLRLKEVPA
jgi:hypothetical protein